MKIDKNCKHAFDTFHGCTHVHAPSSYCAHVHVLTKNNHKSPQGRKCTVYCRSVSKIIAFIDYLLAMFIQGATETA